MHILELAKHYGLPFLVVISVVVFVHEFGHYLVARLCGIRVLNFSIGFGPEIFGWNDRHGTRWQVACIPMGGYVKMFGDADPASTPNAAVKDMTDEEKRVAFFHQHVDKRIAVVAAGPVFNYIFAVLVLTFMFALQGEPYSLPNVSEIMENSAAAKAGMQVGDHVTVIDGQHIDRFEDIKRLVALNDGSPMKITIERNGASQTLTVTPEMVTMSDRFGGTHTTGRLGIVSEKLEYQKWPPLRAAQEAVSETWNITTGTLKALGQMIMGTRATDELGGPLRIAEMSGHVAEDGAVALIWFMAVISINLGFINLFPVPLLDGGHLAFYAYERLRGRPLSETWQENGARVGMVLVLSLMVFATWNDLVHLKVIAYLRGLFS